MIPVRNPRLDQILEVAGHDPADAVLWAHADSVGKGDEVNYREHFGHLLRRSPGLVLCGDFIADDPATAGPLNALPPDQRAFLEAVGSTCRLLVDLGVLAESSMMQVASQLPGPVGVRVLTMGANLGESASDFVAGLAAMMTEYGIDPTA